MNKKKRHLIKEKEQSKNILHIIVHVQELASVHHACNYTHWPFYQVPHPHRVHFCRYTIRDCIPSVAKPHPRMGKNHHKTTAEQIQRGGWTLARQRHGHSMRCAVMSIRQSSTDCVFKHCIFTGHFITNTSCLAQLVGVQLQTIACVIYQFFIRFWSQQQHGDV